jgi:GNAT superfamily N-acetyltransferase
MDFSEIEYNVFKSADIDIQTLEAAKTLFDAHYGVWSKRSLHRPGERITLSTERLRAYISQPGDAMSCAYFNGALVGQAFCRSVDTASGLISWVTLFVVDTNFQHRGIGTALLRNLFKLQAYAGWGIASSNPFAIRALESAVGKKADPEVIKNWCKNNFVDLGKSVKYLQGVPHLVRAADSTVDTSFYVDREAIQAYIESNGVLMDWKLGNVEYGEEWIAVILK